MDPVDDTWPHLAESVGLDAGDYSAKLIQEYVGSTGTRSVFRLDGADHALIFKHDPEMPLRRFRSRTDRHVQAHDIFAGLPKMSVPRLVAADPDLRATLMECSHDRTARQALSDARDAKARFDILRACAAWVRHLHRGCDAREHVFRPEARCRDLVEWRAAVETGSRRVAEGAAFVAAVDTAIASARAMSGQATVKVVAHGDLGLRNLLVGPEREITGIDFNMPKMQEPGVDLARLFATYPMMLERLDEAASQEIATALVIMLEEYGADDGTFATVMHHLHREVLRQWRTTAPDVRTHNRQQKRRLAAIRFLADCLAEIG